MSIKDQDLADEIIQRLNVLIEDPAVRAFVKLIIQSKVPIDLELAKRHSTIQCWVEGSTASAGFLGMLNGIVGAIRSEYSDIDGWGYIAAVYDSDSGELLKFIRAEDA